MRSMMVLFTVDNVLLRLKLCHVLSSAEQREDHFMLIFDTVPCSGL